MVRLITLLSTLALTLNSGLMAADYSVKTLELAPPSSFSDAVKAELSPQAVQLLKGDKAIYNIWLRKAVPLKQAPDKPANALKALGQTTLMGAISVLGDERDYRDDELYGGDYTIRFGLRPEDGNHLGTSEHLYFAVLIAAKHDQDLGKIVKSKQLVKASSKESANDHPMIMSLFPVAKADDSTPSITEPAHKHTAIRLTVPTTTPDGSEGALTFDLIIEGMADF